MIRRASASSGMSEVLRATATTFDGRDQPGDLLVDPDEAGQRRSGTCAPGRWSKSWSAMPGLWTRTIAWGVVPWISPRVTLLYAGWSSEPWPSTMHPVAAPLALLDQPLAVPWTKSAMTRSTATPQPSIIIPVWPVGTNDADRPAATAARRSSSATDILPIAQSVPTVRITRLPGPWRRPTAVSIRSGGRR